MEETDDFALALDNANKAYATFPAHSRPDIYEIIKEHPIVRQLDSNPITKIIFSEIFKPAFRGTLSEVVNRKGLALNNKELTELYKLLDANMTLQAAPAAGGRRRRRKSTTRVRVRGRPNTRTTRRATYGAKRTATFARAVRARRSSKSSADRRG